MSGSAGTSGVIFDVKEGAVHDGPGLRQTVFLKGCPLRCSWCHNPEGLCIRPELMVSYGACIHCGRCAYACSIPGACAPDGRFDPAFCNACGNCVQACPLRLRKVAGEQISASALAERLLRSAPYYASTGGGTTFSGGEPLMQPEFVLETLSLLGGASHVALETSGYAPEETFAAFQEAFDLIMLDLKQMDDSLHRRFTGVSNERILKNAQRLCRGVTPFIIRIPVIPGVNDTEAHCRGVAELVKDAPALLRVELLPYHVTAGAKYSMTGKQYQPDFDPQKPIHTDLKLFERYNIRSCVL